MQPADGVVHCQSLGCAVGSELSKIPAGIVLSALESPWRWAIFFYFTSLTIGYAYAAWTRQSTDMARLWESKFQSIIVILSILFALLINLAMTLLVTADEHSLIAAILKPIGEWYGLSLFAIMAAQPYWMLIIALAFATAARVFIGGVGAPLLALFVAAPAYWLGTLLSTIVTASTFMIIDNMRTSDTHTGQ